MSPMGIRRLYYLLIAGVFAVWVLSILNGEFLETPIVPDVWIGVAGVALLIGLLIVVVQDREIAIRMMTASLLDSERYRGRERGFVLGFRVVCIACIMVIVILSRPMFRDILKHFWPR